MNNPRAEFLLKAQRNNSIMSSLYDITQKIKEESLNIPEEY